jgi:hypothetical protein
MRVEYLKDACQAKFHVVYAGNLLQIHAKQKEDPLMLPPEEKIEGHRHDDQEKTSASSWVS